MRKFGAYTIVGIALLLAAGFTFAQTTTATVTNAVPLNSYLGVMAYPGSTILLQDSETEFKSIVSLQELYTHVHEQLVGLGWERSRLEEDDEQIVAQYSRGGERLRLELEQEDENRYELEFDVDD